MNFRLVGLLSASILLATLSTVSAQSSMLGFRLGFNTASVSGKDKSDDMKANPGLDIGAYFAIRITKHVAIQPGIDIYGAGYSFDDDDIKTRVNLNYISLPILAKVSAGGDRFRYYGNAGLFYSQGMFISTFSDGEADATSFGDTFFKSTDIGLILGGGGQVRTGGILLGIDLRYRRSLTSIYENGKLYNNVISPTFTLSIPVGSHRKDY